MTRKEVELLYAYILRNHDRLEGETKQLQQNVRYRSIDTVDCLELALAIERYNMFCIVAHDLRHLLRLSDCPYEDDVPDPRKPLKRSE